MAVHIPKSLENFQEECLKEEEAGNYSRAIHICKLAKKEAKDILIEKRGFLSQEEKIQLRFYYKSGAVRCELLEKLMKVAANAEDDCSSVTSDVPSSVVVSESSLGSDDGTCDFSSSISSSSRRSSISSASTVIYNPKAGTACAVASDQIKGQSAKDFDAYHPDEFVFRIPNVSWSEVIGMEASKDAILQAIRLRVDFPGSAQAKNAWKGILLFGPSGVGKTRLIKAVATECKIPFFNVTVSDILSKWQGDSAKAIKSIFEKAREQGSAIIFIDECDAFCRTRSADECEGSAKVKNELLAQMDGFVENPGITVIGNTNIPQAFDDAFLRRFQKRVYVPLPNRDERVLLLQSFTSDYLSWVTPADFEYIATLTKGYSGADIFTLVVVAGLEQCEGMYSGNLGNLAAASASIKLRPITRLDMLNGLRKVKATNKETFVRELERWNEVYGDGGRHELPPNFQILGEQWANAPWHLKLCNCLLEVADSCCC